MSKWVDDIEVAGDVPREFLKDYVLADLETITVGELEQLLSLIPDATPVVLAADDGTPITAVARLLRITDADGIEGLLLEGA